jgi:hypothetical protein
MADPADLSLDALPVARARAVTLDSFMSDCVDHLEHQRVQVLA